jgi:hypothetical protein
MGVAALVVYLNRKSVGFTTVIIAMVYRESK